MSVVSAGLVIGWYKSNRLEKEARESTDITTSFQTKILNKFTIATQNADGKVTVEELELARTLMQEKTANGELRLDYF